MAKNTKIQWCDSTANPTVGCDGCELWNLTTGVKKCYAGKITERFGKSNAGLADSFDAVAAVTGRMEEAAKWRDLAGTKRPDKPWLDGLPRLIFVSDMADALSEAIEFEYLKSEIIDNVTTPNGLRHQWLWLTKRPARMAEFSVWLTAQDVTWPANLWAGTSITTQATTTRVRDLLKVGGPNSIRFLSVEPQWEPVNVRKWLPRLDWLIQGGESGTGAKPFDIAWARQMLADCRKAGVPYFLKQLGSWVVRDGERVAFEDYSAGDWSEWPRDLRVRQMPIKRPRGRRRR